MMRKMISLDPCVAITRLGSPPAQRSAMARRRPSEPHEGLSSKTTASSSACPSDRSSRSSAIEKFSTPLLLMSISALK